MMGTKHRRDLLAEALRAHKECKPQSDEQFWLWIERVLGFRIAWRAVCPEHQAPFQFLADAFFRRFTGAVLHGPRGGGKTRNLSILHLANEHFDPGFQTSHVAAVQRQANLCYSYVRGYLRDPDLGSKLLGEPLMTETRWKHGGRLEILPGSLRATSGPHPQRAVFDELDLSDWAVHQQFVGMAASTDAYEAQSVYTSAMLTSHGLLSRVIEEAPASGLKVYRYCVWEAMEPCATCEDAERVSRGIKFETPSCPLWEQCQGRARDSTGHIKKADVINKFLESDEDTWAVQYLCRRGSHKGLVYESFEATDGPIGKTNVSSDVRYDAELPLIYLTDDGYAPDPMVFLFAQPQSNGDLWIIDEMYVTRCLYEQAISFVCQIRPSEYGQDEATWAYQVQEWEDGVGPRPTGEVREYKQPGSAYGGVTDTQLRAHLSKLGIRVMAPKKTRVLEGIAEVRKMVRDANGHRGLVFHPRCKNAIRDFTLYHRRRVSSGEYTEEPAPNVGRSNRDDACDCVRVYAAHRLESRSKVIKAAW